MIPRDADRAPKDRQGSALMFVAGLLIGLLVMYVAVRNRVVPGADPASESIPQIMIPSPGEVEELDELQRRNEEAIKRWRRGRS